MDHDPLALVAVDIPRQIAPYRCKLSRDHRGISHLQVDLGELARLQTDIIEVTFRCVRGGSDPVVW